MVSGPDPPPLERGGGGKKEQPFYVRTRVRIRNLRNKTSYGISKYFAGRMPSTASPPPPFGMTGWTLSTDTSSPMPRYTGYPDRVDVQAGRWQDPICHDYAPAFPFHRVLALYPFSNSSRRYFSKMDKSIHTCKSWCLFKLVRPSPLIGENPVCALFLSTSLHMPHTCVGGVVPKA